MPLGLLASIVIIVSFFCFTAIYISNTNNRLKRPRPPKEEELLLQKEKLDRLRADLDERSAIIANAQKSIRQRSAELDERKASLDIERNILNSRKKSLDAVRDALDTKKKALSEIEERINQAADAFRIFDLSPFVPNDFPYHAVGDYSDSSMKRLVSAVSGNLSIDVPFSCSATVIGSRGTRYKTSLTHCTCEDYKHHDGPCKHMIFLALSIGCSAYRNNEAVFSQIRDLQVAYKKEKDEKAELQSLYNKIKSLREDVVRLVKEKKQTYPWLSKQIADLYTKYDSDLVASLKSKRRPAIQAATNVQEISSNYRAALQKLKQTEYQLSVYEAMFPFLEEFKELTPDEALSARSIVCDSSGDYDHSRDWLSKDEYKKLSSSERDQLALNRYCSRNKTNWEAGIEYEQYIGYLCESKNYHVSYTGATKGLEDMGRDLILTSRGKTIMIQCKRWSGDKIIHEKHIFQLYGSVVVERVLKNSDLISGVLITSASLSDLARKCAKELCISLVEQFPFSDYPRIKCNISSSGEKIYHLPFDQQYNNIVIDYSRGEFYAQTTDEAVSAGFRRAFRWHSTAC